MADAYDRDLGKILAGKHVKDSQRWFHMGEVLNVLKFGVPAVSNVGGRTYASP
jgi:hypothetical protein